MKLVLVVGMDIFRSVGEVPDDAVDSLSTSRIFSGQHHPDNKDYL